MFRFKALVILLSRQMFVRAPAKLHESEARKRACMVSKPCPDKYKKKEREKERYPGSRIRQAACPPPSLPPSQPDA